MIPVLRASLLGWIPGTGASDASGRGFQFPPVGSSFEWPGPELIAIRGDARPFPNEYEGRQLHTEGIHGYSWGLSTEPEFEDQVQLWRRQGLDDWLVLDVAPEDLVFDKRRACGKCRAKRGSVTYLGSIVGAVDLLRSRWEGTPLAWDDSALFPVNPAERARERNRESEAFYASLHRGSDVLAWTQRHPMRPN